MKWPTAILLSRVPKEPGKPDPTADRRVGGGHPQPGTVSYTAVTSIRYPAKTRANGVWVGPIQSHHTLKGDLLTSYLTLAFRLGPNNVFQTAARLFMFLPNGLTSLKRQHLIAPKPVAFATGVQAVIE